jgi:uncharacterized protein YyaL (SSP411 family)
MLYDNALLIDLLTEVWRETHEPLFAVIAESVAWLDARSLTHCAIEPMVSSAGRSKVGRSGG